MTHLGDLLSAYIDGELTGDEERGVLAHLDECGECRAELGEIDVARTAVRSLPVLELPPGLVPFPLRRPRGRRWLAAAAAAAVILVGLAVAGPVTGGRQMDLPGAVSQRAARVSVDPGLSSLRFVSVVNSP